MRELLFFPENLNEPLQWASFNPDGQLALLDPIKRSDFGGLKALKKKSVTIVLPGQQVASYCFAMPKVSGQGKEQAIAYALEGICSQPLEEIYVIPGPYVDGKQSAMVVSQQYLDSVLAFVKMHQLKVISIRVDYMLLAKPKAGKWVVTQLGNDILWKTDRGTGGRVESALWPFILEQVFDKQDQAPQELLWEVEANQTMLPLPETLVGKCEQQATDVPSWVDAHILATATPYHFNVGSQKLNSLFNKNKSTVKRIFWILFIAILGSLILQIGFTTFVNIKLHKEQALMHKYLTPLGYGNMTIGEVKDRLSRAISAAEKMQSEDNFLYILGNVSHALTPADINDIQQIDYKHHQGVAIQFPKNNIQSIVNVLKANLPNDEVKLIANQKGDKSPNQFILIKKVNG